MKKLKNNQIEEETDETEIETVITFGDLSFPLKVAIVVCWLWLVISFIGSMFLMI